MRFTHQSVLTAILAALTAIHLNAQHGAGMTAQGRSAPVRAQPAAPRPAVPVTSYVHPGSQIQNLGGRPYPIRTDIPPPLGLNPPAASYTGISPGAFKSPHYGSFGGRGAGFIGAPGYFPFLSYGPSLYPTVPADQAPFYDPGAQAMAQQQDAMAEQLQQLTAEIDSLKRQQSPPTPPLVVSNEPAQAVIPVTLILRNGEQLTVRSYAVMNGTFWDFSKQPTRKIPLSSIDLSASQKATEAQGGEFPEISPDQSREQQ